MSGRLRILLTFLGWVEGLSGGDRHLLEMGARWSSDVTVHALAPPPAAELLGDFLGSDVVVHRLGSAGRWSRRRGAWLAGEYARRAARAAVHVPGGYDVVCGASHFAADAVAISKSARAGAVGVGYVYHLIAGRPSRDVRTRWGIAEEQLGLRLLRRYASIVFTSNSATRAALRRAGIDSVHTDVGVDLSAFSVASAARRPPVGLFVGRLVPSKGVVDAVEAWAAVRTAIPSARLIVAGVGQERARAEARARELGIADAVEWRGFVSEEVKRELLHTARVFLAPSYEEGWGISVCEALASGLPVVAYRLPTLDELFGESYAAVAPADRAGLAERVIELLRRDDLVETMSRRGRATAERYALDTVANAELATILAAVETRRREGGRKAGMRPHVR